MAREHLTATCAHVRNGLKAALIRQVEMTASGHTRRELSVVVLPRESLEPAGSWPIAVGSFAGGKTRPLSGAGSALGVGWLTT